MIFEWKFKASSDVINRDEIIRIHVIIVKKGQILMPLKLLRIWILLNITGEQ